MRTIVYTFGDAESVAERVYQDNAPFLLRWDTVPLGGPVLGGDPVAYARVTLQNLDTGELALDEQISAVIDDGATPNGVSSPPDYGLNFRTGAVTMLADRIAFAENGRYQVSLFIYDADRVLQGTSSAELHVFGEGVSRTMAEAQRILARVSSFYRDLIKLNLTGAFNVDLFAQATDGSDVVLRYDGVEIFRISGVVTQPPALLNLSANPSTTTTDGAITISFQNAGGTIGSIEAADNDGPIDVAWTPGQTQAVVSEFNGPNEPASITLTARNVAGSSSASVGANVEAPAVNPIRYYGTDAADLVALIGTDAAAAATAVLALSSRRDANTLGSETLSYASGEYGYWVVVATLQQPNGFSIDGGLAGALPSATLSITNDDGTAVYRVYRTSQYAAGNKTLAAV